MISRIIFAVREGWRYRAQLGAYVHDPALHIKSVFDLNPQELITKGVRILAFDFDGVLAAHGEPQPRPDVAIWLRGFITEFSGQVYILSNKPSLQRQDYFKQHFPSVIFIWAIRKKPYPDGMQQILKDAQVMPAQAVLIDDRLGTGILAALICLTPAIWVTKPFINFRGRPLQETGFLILRGIEKAFFGWFGLQK